MQAANAKHTLGEWQSKTGRVIGVVPDFLIGCTHFWRCGNWFPTAGVANPTAMSSAGDLQAGAIPFLEAVSGGPELDDDPDSAIGFGGRGAGGTTTINNAICLRYDDPGISPDDGPDLLDRWSDLGTHIDRAELDAAYGRVEKMIGVRPLLQAQAEAIPSIDP